MTAAPRWEQPLRDLVTVFTQAEAGLRKIGDEARSQGIMSEFQHYRSKSEGVALARALVEEYLR